MAPERRRYSILFAESPLISSGDIIFNGQSIVGKRPFEICHAGIARTFQLNAAFETMTVRENVLIASQHGGPSSANCPNSSSIECSEFMPTILLRHAD